MNKTLYQELEEKLGSEALDAHLARVFEFSVFEPNQGQIEKALRALAEKVK